MRIPGPALVLPLFLAGCALPPAVTVASLVLDGVSYISTGKSSTDHAISAIAHEDCALLRVVDDKPICDPDGDVLVALSVGDAADVNWSLDPETGSVDPNTTTHWGPAADLEANIEATPEPRRELSQAAIHPQELGCNSERHAGSDTGPRRPR